MTSKQAYIQFLQLVNRNATNNNVSVDKARFVMLFNSMQNKWIEWNLEKRNEDSIRNIQIVLVSDLAMTLKESTDRYSKYSLPANYFDFSNVTTKVKTECCKASDMLLFEVKSEDVEEKLVDTNNVPSFEYRESFYYISDNSVTLFKKDFEYEEVLLTYYRYPVQVELAGYQKIDGTTTLQDIDPEFDDKVVERILLAMSKEFSAINSDTNEYQMTKDRLFTI